MPNKMTAVAVVTSVVVSEETTQVNLNADYADERNKEWSKYTPSLSVMMTVKNSVAEYFLPGRKLLLTFEDQSNE